MWRNNRELQSSGRETTEKHQRDINAVQIFNCEVKQVKWNYWNKTFVDLVLS